MTKHKFLTLLVALCATTALWASNTITYTATKKLSETTSSSTSGLHTNAFNVKITSHEFSNGVGTVTFDGEVKTIGEYAFYNCSGLTSITIPNSVTKIGDYAFAYCSGLTSVTIPNSVTTIGEYAFVGCTSLPIIDNLRYADTTYLVAAVDKTLSTYMIKEGTKWIGFGAFRGCRKLTSVTIPNSVTSIGYEAFYGCYGLTSVTIPNSVTTIGEYAFAGCSGLTSVTIPNSVTTIGKSAFSGCSGLTSITIPNSVTKIGNVAFGYCSGLTSVTLNSNAICSKNYSYKDNIGSIFGSQVKEYIIGNSVTKIGSYAFYSCSGLTSVTIPNSVTSIGSYAFYCVNNIIYNGTATGSPWRAKCVNGYVDGYLVYSDATKTTLCGCFTNATGAITIPNSVTTIGERAFYKCSGLVSINVDAANTHYASVDGVLFNYAKDTLIQYPIGNSRTEYTIPNSVTTIGDRAFGWCDSLTSVTIPNSVTTIGNYAFEECSGLTSVTIPNSVTSIGYEAFYSCSGLTSVTLNSDAICSETYTQSSNIGTIFGSQVKEYIIGNSVTEIGNVAFYGCSGLTSVTIPNSVTTIGEYAFVGCSGLTSVTIPNSVTTIGKSAFSGCSGLTSVTIPHSVTTIGERAFYNCSGLTSVTCEAAIPPTCGSYCFDGVDTSIPLYVLAGSVKVYKTANGWKSFTNIQPIIDETCIITYTATEKLTRSTLDVGVTTFGPAIISHSFSNGTGTITCRGEITTIGEDAFYYCTKLTSVTIPNSVTTIGDAAFAGCSGLTSVTIPNSVTEIERYAFSSCDGLTSITIGNSVKTIGDWAFNYCDGLISVTLNSDAICSKTYYDGLRVRSIGSIFGSQVKEYIIGNSVTKIGSYAFYDCSGLTSITIPNSVTTIGEWAFRGCSGLTSVTIPNSVTTIENRAFSGCSGLTSVNIPNSVTTIGSSAFYKCSGLISVTLNSDAICSETYYGYNIGSIFGSQVKEYIIGNSVTTIGNSAFRDCSGLTSITIGNSVTTIVGYAFEGCDGLTKTNYTGTIADWCKIKFWGDVSNPIYYSHNFFINDVEIKDLVIPEGVDTIGRYAFAGCSGLTSVTIGNSVIEIGNSAFEYCKGLTSVTLNSDAICSETYTPNYGNIGSIFGSQVKEYIIGNSVTKIGDYAFEGCNYLTYVTIPNSVTTIGEGGFANCYNLTSVTIPNSVTTIGESAFRGCSGLTSVTFLGKDCQNNIGDDAFYNVGKNAPATLFLPADWTGSKPMDSKTKWYGGYFTYTDTPTAIESIDDTQCTMHKFLRNGQVIIRKNNKTYNVLGQEL